MKSENPVSHSDIDNLSSRGYSRVQKIGLFLGLVIFLVTLLLPAPDGLSPQAWRATALALLMFTWWITEALPLYVTSLLPLILLPALGVLDARKVSASYAEPTIFLFMGGFFLAVAMQRWGLHKRIAAITLKTLGSQPRRLLFGVMATTAMISLFVSNTATTLMIYPIGLALMAQMGTGSSERNGFGTALMLGIAYAASIGGVGTLIGTTPNVILAGQAKLLFPDLPEVTFLNWMLVGVPYVILFLPLAWLYLALAHVPAKSQPEDAHLLRESLGELGKITRGELGVLIIFSFAVLGWIFREDMSFGAFVIPGWANLLGVGPWVQDSTVAILAALLLFLVPVNWKKGEFLLRWEQAVQIPWGILILLGGGFALALSFQETGLSSWLGGHLAALGGIHPILLVFIICLFLTALGEMASNTALAFMFIPVLGTTAAAIGVHPYLLLIPATMACSSGFMLPVATPPNAIVMASGAVTIQQMARAGLALDLIAAVIITLITFLIAVPVFGL